VASVRVRFAPSPTGFLHVGGARTAIFNWLYARRHGGVFVLRIEDTDLERSSGPMARAILDGMAWLGLNADEGPFYQAAERERHVGDARRLMEDDRAYRCFCSAESIRLASEAAREAGGGYRYPGTCRELDADGVAERVAAGEPFAVRFRSPAGGDVRWEDQVHGTTAVGCDQIDDFIILRSDGSPTYNLSVVSDDAAMRITHVIRGDDHLSNTPKQILIYRALGLAPPTFAHLPLILGTDKKRLSKRHGAVSVMAYRDEGYLPEAMLNFLALLGWSPGDDRQLMDRDELIREFDLDRVGRSGAIFDTEKLEWLNSQLLAKMPAEQLEARLRPLLEEAGLWDETFAGPRREWFHRTLVALAARARRLADFIDRGRPFLDPSDKLDYEEKAAKKHLKGDGLAEHLRCWLARIDEIDPWEPEPLEQALRALATERDISPGKLIHPTRLALTGMGVGPGIFEVMELVGRERSRRRLQRLIEHLESGTAS